MHSKYPAWNINTPGTRGGPGGRFAYIFYLCQNIGETNFQPREIPRSGSKGKDGKQREKEIDTEMNEFVLAHFRIQSDSAIYYCNKYCQYMVYDLIYNIIRL